MEFDGFYYLTSIKNKPYFYKLYRTLLLYFKNIERRKLNFRFSFRREAKPGSDIDIVVNFMDKKPYRN